MPNATATAAGPGTPVQMAGLGILALTGKDPLAYSSFLAVAHPLAALLTLAAGLLLARRVFAGLPLPLQVAALWVYFLCPQALEYDNVWSPETFCFPAGSLFLVGLWGLARQETSARRLWAAGLALGLCCSVKLTFLAWVPAFLLALALDNRASTHGRLFRVGNGLAATVGGFFLATLPVVAGYPYLVGWAWRLATHSGQYGAGSAGPPNLADALANWRVALESAKGWWLLSAVCLLVVLWSMASRPKQTVAPADGRLFLLTFALAALGASFVFVSRQVALRYLLPTGFCGMILFALAARHTALQRAVWAQLLVTGVVGLLLLKHLDGDRSSHDRRIEEAERLHGDIHAVIAAASRPGAQPPTVLYCFRVPEPSFALRYNASNADLLRQIEVRYPNEGHYDVWSKRVHLPGGRSHWSFLVIAKEDLTVFPEPTGPVLGEVGGYCVVAASARDQ